MADNEVKTASLELVYVPDTYTETERQEGASWPLGSGHYDLMVVAGDARIRLTRFKAGQIDKEIALAKERRKNESEQQQQTQQQTPPPPEQQQAPPPEQQQQTPPPPQ